MSYDHPNGFIGGKFHSQFEYTIAELHQVKSDLYEYIDQCVPLVFWAARRNLTDQSIAIRVMSSIIEDLAKSESVEEYLEKRAKDFPPVIRSTTVEHLNPTP